MVIGNKEIKILGYMCLNYGKTYLKESLSSVVDYVDKFYIMYSPIGSYGFHSNVRCPDSKEELYSIAQSVLGDKMVWHEKTYGNEGEHRSEIYKFSEGYSLVVAIDSDEIFDPNTFPNAIKLAFESDKRFIGFSGYLNFFRSFNHVCTDGFTPIRITNLMNDFGEDVVPCTVYHFSCAQSLETMIYKLLIHGHKDEIRPNWLMDVYLKWTPENNNQDLHLVAHGLWNAVPFDKTTLPDSLKSHPNYDKYLI